MAFCVHLTFFFHSACLVPGSFCLFQQLLFYFSMTATLCSPFASCFCKLAYLCYIALFLMIFFCSFFVVVLFVVIESPLAICVFLTSHYSRFPLCLFYCHFTSLLVILFTVVVIFYPFSLFLFSVCFFYYQVICLYPFL